MATPQLTVGLPKRVRELLYDREWPREGQLRRSRGNFVWMSWRIEGPRLTNGPLLPIARLRYELLQSIQTNVLLRSRAAKANHSQMRRAPVVHLPTRSEPAPALHMLAVGLVPPPCAVRRRARRQPCSEDLLDVPVRERTVAAPLLREKFAERIVLRHDSIDSDSACINQPLSSPWLVRPSSSGTTEIPSSRNKRLPLAALPCRAEHHVVAASRTFPAADGSARQPNARTCSRRVARDSPSRTDAQRLARGAHVPVRHDRSNGPTACAAMLAPSSARRPLAGIPPPRGTILARHQLLRCAETAARRLAAARTSPQ